MIQHIIEKDRYLYDVFLSHASEDKDAVARPLAGFLEELGLTVWYDETELRKGDRLVAKLNNGISASRFGILILSKHYFGKRWTNFELDTLEYLAVTEDRVLIPIWHNISESEVRALRPSLANLLAWNTATRSIKQIADEIYDNIATLYMREQAARD